MDVEYVELLLGQLINPNNENMQEVNSILLDFVEDPQSIFILFQIIDKKNTERNTGKLALSLISHCMKNNFYKLSSQIQKKIINKFINFLYSELSDDFGIKLISEILIQYIKGHSDYYVECFHYIDSSIEKKENIFASILILDKIVEQLDKNSKILLDSKEKFFNYSLIGLQDYDFHIVAESAQLYLNLKNKNLSTSNEPHLDIVIKTLLTPEFFNIDLWNKFCKIISKDLIPANEVKKIISLVENGLFENEMAFLFFISSIKYFDANKVSQILNGLIKFLIEQYEENIVIDSLLLHEMPYRLSPIKNLYSLLRHELKQLSMCGSNSEQDLYIYVYIIIIHTCPNEFLNDIDSFISDINSALDKNNELLNNLILSILEEYQNIFDTCDLIAIEFLPKIIKFLASYDGNISMIAFRIVESFIDCIDTSIPWLFKCVYSAKDYFFSTCSEQYIRILAKAIDKNGNLSTFQIKTLLDHLLDQPVDIIYLPLLVVIMKQKEEMVEMIFPQIIKILNDVSLTQINNDIYMINFLKEFGTRFSEQLQFFNQSIQKIVFSENSKDYEVICLLHLASIFVEITNDKQLAIKLEKKCLDLINCGNFYNLSDVFNSCCYIIKSLDQRKLKKMLFSIYLFINKTNKKERAFEALFLIKKMLHNSCDEDKEFYLSKSIEILEKILNGSLKCLKNKEILFYSNDVILMNDVSRFLVEVVRYQSTFIETISNFVIKVIKSYQNAPFLTYYIGVSCELFLHKTIPENAKQEIIDLIPQLIQIAKYSSLKQNVSYLLYSMVKYDSKLLQILIQYIPVLQNWYLDEKKSKYVHKELLLNISLAFLIFLESGLKIDTVLLNEAISEFPFVNKKETALALQSIISIFTSNKIESSCIKNAAFALSELFLLSDYKIKNIKMSAELIEKARNLFTSFSDSNPEIMKELNEKFKDSQEKIAKLNDIINK